MRGPLLSLSMLLLLTARAAAGLFDDESANNTIATAGTQVLITGNPTVEGGILTLSFFDLDYLGIAALSAGDILTVSTTPLVDPPAFETPDTIVGIFDVAGTHLCIGDDAFNNELENPPRGFGSLCRLVVDASGDYFVGVTGFSPIPFDGLHLVSGDYELTVTVTTLPEPGMLLQLVSGLLGLVVLGRRRRSANR